jgi:hypothetical protein
VRRSKFAVNGTAWPMIPRAPRLAQFIGRGAAAPGSAWLPVRKTR